MNPQPVKHLILMACSATKGRVEAPAMDLYQGVMYSTFRANAPATRPAVVILSAKHGFIEADRSINPYEQRMTEARADEMVAALPAFDTIEWPCGVSSILMAGGKTYQRVMRAAIARRIELGLLDAGISIENTHGGIGYQRSQLGAHLRALADSYMTELDGKLSACHPRSGLSNTLNQMHKLRKAMKSSKV